MAPRPFWKGYLKLSLVTCPVALTPATTDADKVRFHTLNRKTGNRVVSRYVDAATGKPVDEDDAVKGYARDENAFVLLDDEELDAVRLESARTIDIESFVAADSVDWIWYETPYYLTPDDKVGEEAYCVIRDAMRATGMVGVSRLVLHRRERAVLLKPRDKGIELWTLRYGAEVRDPDELFRNVREAEPDPALLDLVAELIEERRKPWSPEMVRDPVQDRLVEMISEKRKNVPPSRPKADAGAGSEQRGQYHGRAAQERRRRGEGEEGQAAELKRPVPAREPAVATVSGPRLPLFVAVLGRRTPRPPFRCEGRP